LGKDVFGIASKSACCDALDLFLARVSEAPSHAAVVVDDVPLSYAPLARTARCFARVFARFVEPRVMIALAAGGEAYAAMLAAGLAGGCYAPVNVASPPLKLRRIARLLQPNVIVADRTVAPFLCEEAPQALLVRPDGLPDDPPAGEWTRRPGHKIGYVMFTSRSTGDPKGVVNAIPKIIHVVEQMPRNENGKIDRRAVAACIDAREADRAGVL
jgi:acyl-CoA synthetase (AMP-forming)/AMP-acid ligase II